jgi:hypothetical protein
MDKMYVDMSDQELLEEYDRLGRIYMYYQAAEGNYAKETKDRLAAEAEFFDCQHEVRERNLPII